MPIETLTIFSCKDIADIEELGAVGWFRISQRRVSACRYVVIYHNSKDPRKPGDPEQHRYPVAVACISGLHVSPIDGRVAVTVSEVASAAGDRMENPSRSPVTYTDDGLINRLQVGHWNKVPQRTLEQALAARHAWDARNRAR